MKKLLLLLSVLFVISCTKDPIIYTLTTSANPSEGGAVSPTTKQYEEGETATITATASSEYVFQSWSGATGSTNSTSVVMNSDKSVTANFVKKKYALTTAVEGEGTVSEKVIKAGAATDYNSGTIVELTATPIGEWLFVEWKGDVTGTENPTQITIDKAKSVTAVFVKKQYPLIIEIEGEGTVTEEVIKQGLATDYNSGTIVELTATPSDDWEFVEWTGDLTGSDNPKEITIDNVKTVKAVFSRIEYTLSIDFKGKGSAKIYLEKENQTDSVLIVEKTDLKYFIGDKLKIKAVPDEGWSFKSFSNGWENPVDLVINSNLSTTISFEYTQPVVDSNGNSYNVASINGVIWTTENFKGLKSKDDSMKVYELDGTSSVISGIFPEFDTKNSFGVYNSTALFNEFKQNDSAIIKITLNNSTIVFYRNDYKDLIIPEGWRIANTSDYQNLIDYTETLTDRIGTKTHYLTKGGIGMSNSSANLLGFSSPSNGWFRASNSGTGSGCGYANAKKWTHSGISDMYWTSGSTYFHIGNNNRCPGSNLYGDFDINATTDTAYAINYIRNSRSLRLVKID